MRKVPMAVNFWMRPLGKSETYTLPAGSVAGVGIEPNSPSVLPDEPHCVRKAPSLLNF